MGISQSMAQARLSAGEQIKSLMSKLRLYEQIQSLPNSRKAGLAVHTAHGRSAHAQSGTGKTRLRKTIPTV